MDNDIWRVCPVCKSDDVGHYFDEVVDNEEIKEDEDD